MALTNIHRISVPSEALSAGTKFAIAQAARSLTPALITKCYESLASHHSTTSQTNLQELVSELNRFAVDTLHFDAGQVGGVRGQPPAIRRSVAQIAQLEQYGARLKDENASKGRGEYSTRDDVESDDSA